MDVIWLSLIGLMLGGWFVIDGANLGIGMSLRRIGRTGPERRMLLTAMGPFMLAGEVWLIAAAGLLIGAYPGLEKDLLHAYYPLFVAILAAWILRDLGVWFRSRRPSVRWRGTWERVIVVASGVVAFAWGMVLGNVVQGVPRGDRPGLGTLVGPYSLLWGAIVVAVFGTHGAVFAALRMPDGRRERAAAVARRFAVAAAALLGAAVILTPALTFSRSFSIELAQPVPALILQVIAVTAVTFGARLVGRERDGRAYACTAVAALAPLVAVGVAVSPRLLEGAAGAHTLDLLAVVALPVLPVVILVQAWLWWLFRQRVDARSAVFF